MISINGKKIISNIGWLVFEKVFALLIGLFVIIRISNYYGPSEYGMYQYALSIVTLLGVVVLFLDSRVVKKRYNGLNDGHIIFNITVAKVFLSIILFILGLGILLVSRKGTTFNVIFLLLLVNNIVINLGFGIQNYFEYQLKSRNIVIAANIAITISCIFQLVSIRLDFPIIAIVIILLISSVIKLAILILQFRSSYTIKPDYAVDKRLIASIIRESVPLAIAATAFMIYSRIDQVMIGEMLNVTQVGIYAISTKMIGVMAIAIGPVQVSIFPKMIDEYNNDRALYYKRYQALTSLMTWIYIIGAIVVFLIAPMLFDRLFTKAYANSLYVFKIQAVGTLFMYNAILRSSYYTLNKNTKVMMISQIIAVIINVILNYTLIPLMGIQGAAIATVITQFCSLFFLNIFFKEGKKVFWLQCKGFNPLYIKDLL